MAGYQPSVYPGNLGGYPGGGSISGHGGYPGTPPPPSGMNPNVPPHKGMENCGNVSNPNAQQGGNPVMAGYGKQVNVDPEVAEWFKMVDVDNSGQISSLELRRALVNGNWKHFSEEACRMIIEMYDRNASGSIDVSEFQQLFNSINQWRGIFQQYDNDKSGLIEESELIQAFQQMGYRFGQPFIRNLLGKYDSRTRRISLDNFIVIGVQIKRLTDGFRTRDRAMQGQATFQYEDFLGLAMGISPI